jgi:large subunit ribosomal protein L27
MAHTKALGTTKLGRDSRAQRLGVKVHDGGKIKIGQIIIRQRGSKYLAGKNVLKGKDDTLFAKVDGVVKFGTKTKVCFDGSKRTATIVNVV